MDDSGLRERVVELLSCVISDPAKSEEQVADAILALVDAEYRPGWVSVKERLPEVVTAPDGSCDCVLVYAKDGFECGSDIQVVATAWAVANKNWERFTHWMPLPSPPKEEP
jgi:hypothetical protein